MLSIDGTQEIALRNQDDPWTNAYDAAAPAYERPSLVSQFYANNLRYPIEWGDPELGSIFNSSSGGGGGNDKINNTSPGTTTNRIANDGTGVTGRIVGGVIGGMLGCMIIIFSLILWRRRRPYERKETDIDEQIAGVHEFPGTSAVHEVPGACHTRRLGAEAFFHKAARPRRP